MFDLLWDLFQQGQIGSAQSEAESARSQAGVAARQAGQSLERSQDSEERIARLALLCQAMWELLSERCQVTNNDLVRKVLEVDRRDGREDGRIGERVIDCPKCGNKVNSRRPKCVICGSVLATKQPFEVC